MKKILSALFVCMVLAPSASQAATCMLKDGKWLCGGATLKKAKSACNATTGHHNHSCDEGINVCTCATRSSAGNQNGIQTIDVNRIAGTSIEIQTQSD